MTDKPNLVLLTIDSLRADHCGFMGDDRGLTPNMDRLAEDGLVFERAISPGPSTLDALPGTFTGVDLAASEADTRDLCRHHLRATDPIPERLSRLGYETGGFTANPWTSRYFGFDRGFDHFEDFMAEADGEGDTGDGSRLAYGLRLLKNWSREAGMVASWDSFYDEVVEWTESAGEPYFCWVFLVDVHMPYLPVPEFRSQSRLGTYASNLWLYLTGHDPDVFEGVASDRLRSAYEDTIRYTDDRLGQFVEDVGEETTVVVHADHGEAFGERGVYGHGPTLSTEQIHVPLFVANGPSGRVSEPLSLRRLPDLLTTLADDGDPSSLTGPVATARNRNPRYAVRGCEWKYVETPDGDRLTVVDDDGTRPLSNPALESLASSVVDTWCRGEQDRETIRAASRTLAAEHML
jgi:arylsulfatase A-like enzyme